MERSQEALLRPLNCGYRVDGKVEEGNRIVLLLVEDAEGGSRRGPSRCYSGCLPRSTWACRFENRICQDMSALQKIFLRPIGISSRASNILSSRHMFPGISESRLYVVAGSAGQPKEVSNFLESEPCDSFGYFISKESRYQICDDVISYLGNLATSSARIETQTFLAMDIMLKNTGDAPPIRAVFGFQRRATSS